MKMKKVLADAVAKLAKYMAVKIYCAASKWWIFIIPKSPKALGR